MAGNQKMDKNLQIFKSLFKGREDVFAIRWERDDNSGYTPAYNLNWNEFKIFKAKGGSLKDFKDKEYAPLTNERISNHLSGREVIGVYPLLKDNTSWFIAADFDQSTSKTKRWIEECKAFMMECEKYGLPVYMERSRSGAGGHVWLFFEEPYPAVKSRQIFMQLLASSGVITELNKNSNFDRLFPNQDMHSGKGFGNLIALPLQKKALDNGNTCFINPEDETPFADQWSVLGGIQKVKNKTLDDLLKTIPGNKKETPTAQNPLNGEFSIILGNEIILPRVGLSALVIKFIKDNLRFMNADFLIKKRTGRNTFGTEIYFETVEERVHTLALPRGMIGKLLRYCNEQKIIYRLEDKRVKLEPVKFNSSISMHGYQQEAVAVADKKDFGVIVAPPGSGKTVMGLEIVSRKQQPALIIVHRKQLFDQWIDRIQSFLGIPKFRIGKIEGGRYELGDEITVAMIQSLQTVNVTDKEKLYYSFGTIIVDECHHIPAKTFREVIRHFHSYYLYGFTATPIRKNNDEKLIFIHLGDIIHEVIIPATETQHKALSIVIQNTELFAPFNSATDKIETLINILIHDTARNKIITDDIAREVRAGRKILVLTERKSHVDILNQYLKGICETIALTGDDTEQNRKSKLDLVANGDFQVLISTGQFIGEGTDIGTLNCLILTYPFSFEGKLVQYIGRVQRSHDAPVIYDYRDIRIEYFNNQFKQRNRSYRKLMKSGQLKSLDELMLIFNGPSFYVNDIENLLSIDCLDLPLPVQEFKDGVVWKLRVNEYNEEEGELFAEIIDYDFPLSKVTEIKQGLFYFYGIEKVKFRSLDTAGLLKSVTLKKQSVAEPEVPVNNIKQPETTEQVFLKTMKVPFWKISFGYSNVSFPIFINDFNQELVFEIENPDVRPEFAAIREYFSKALKKKMITADIVVRYNESQILAATAKSDDIDSINTHMIDSVRFEFVKREILKGKGQLVDGKIIQTMEDLLGKYEKNNIFSSEDQFVNDILNIRDSKHYLQLKFLSSKHEAAILKLRFVLQPFSFLFLLAGENEYHIIWETLDTEDATYIWHTDKTRESLRNKLNEIEGILGEIKQHGRQFFLDKESSNFNRVVHDYSDPKKGFVLWKAVLEEKLS
jgi:superfamily II DNA or RNA helicase